MNVKRLEAALWRHIIMRDNIGHTHTVKTRIINANAPGISKGDALLSDTTLNLQLDLPAVSLILRLPILTMRSRHLLL